jgi:exonuclease V gamma subunit
MTNFREFQEAITASCIGREPFHFTSSQSLKQPSTQHHVTMCALLIKHLDVCEAEMNDTVTNRNFSTLERKSVFLLCFILVSDDPVYCYEIKYHV